MDVLIGVRVKCVVSFLVFFLAMVNVSFGQEAETIENAIKKGKISGAIGSYYEFVIKDAENSDDGWSTAYFTLKYETLSWKGVKFGARGFVHGELYSYDEDGMTDPFDVDVESQFTLPELYFNYAFTENSNVTAGRWNHQKVTHLDDAQSEGAYVQIKEIEDFELTAGVVRRFAEIDYDDGEDFGRNNGSQDLDSESTYGPGSSAYLYFFEGKYDGINMLTLNPYFMYHDDYASVYGIDTKIEAEMEDFKLTYGGKASYYHVDADISGSGNANNYMIAPFVEKDPVYLCVGYAKFDDGDALNKPVWLRDYLLPVDQLVTYGTSDSDIIFGKLKLTFGDFWTHFAFADSKYATTAGRGDGSKEYELQFGYEFVKNLDLNVRLFDVRFDNIDDRDYQKIESRLRFQF